MEGFFKASELVSKNQLPIVPECGKCGLYKTCKSPKMPVDGDGKKGILIVGDFPGENEDNVGRPFVGQSGRLLQTALRTNGVSIRRDCWITNALICRPPKNSLDPKKTAKQIAACRPNVFNAIQKYEPKIIILAGHIAVKSVLGHIWKDDVGDLSRWLGYRIPCTTPNAWICPIWHPSALLHGTGANNEVMAGFFEKHVSEICKLSRRPWDDVPNYQSQVDVVMDPEKAARVIRKMIRKGGLCAFDYETNMLKPDSPDSRIVCCSICWRGKKTIAYPWTGEARHATREFLLDKRVQKIGCNIKFEDRWSMKEFDIEKIVGWKIDTMNAAHVLDNRSQITSIKFQGFVNFGALVYDHHIRKFLGASSGVKPNRIHEVDLRQLLIYCGVDSLLEFLVGVKQMKELGLE